MSEIKIKIDKGVPIPTGVGKGSGRGGLYPWKKMDIGDSFFIAAKKLPISITATNKRYAPKQFMSRKEGEGFRVWRVM